MGVQGCLPIGNKINISYMTQPAEDGNTNPPASERLQPLWSTACPVHAAACGFCRVLLQKRQIKHDAAMKP
jgi:hypothetical protein